MKNKLWMFYLPAVFLLITACANAEAKAGKIAPFKELLQRLVPGKADRFLYQIIPSVDGKDVFELASGKGKIILRGNSLNSLAVALNHYLKYYCYTSVSWYVDDPVELPATLPLVPGLVRQHARVQDRFFLNYCTFGYTMPWWQWKDWERLIDWMALNGINMPLAITGQEAIWERVWKKFGLDDKQIRGYFTGPAQLPWHRMSEIDRIQGPLPASYIDGQLVLQKQILKRERELGMKPVLTAFAGHVPAAIKFRFPDAKINPLSWGAFPEAYKSYFLDPLDPLFKKIQKVFLEEQTKEYGSDHVYGADPFNEIKPPSWESEFLAQVSTSIYGSIRQSDPSARWLMMGWIFYFERDNWTDERIKAFVNAVPENKLILLDYYCENKEVWKMTDAFFGKNYMWCYLGNFGGNTMLAGNLDTVEKRMQHVFRNGGMNLSGVGSTLEALDVNPLMYEYVFEKVWDDGPADYKSWLNAWSDRRYGAVNVDARQAWEIMGDQVYRSPARLGQATLTNARPSLTGNGAGRWTNPHLSYANQDLMKAWELLLKTESKRASYRFDIVNIGRQVLGNSFLAQRDSFAQAYRLKDTASLGYYGRRMLQVLDDMDALLNTHTDFLLGKWLTDARRIGVDAAEKGYYENNARTILTIWGIKDNSLNDYANRSWAGLMKSFYRERWKMFIQDVIEAVKNRREFDEKVFYRKVTAFEDDWTHQSNQFSDKPAGDTYLMAKTILKRLQGP